MKELKRYLLEFLVIIISILAAFWLDDWGEDKRKIERKVVVLNNLLLELEMIDGDYEFIEINLDERSRQFRYLYNSWGRWEMDSLRISTPSETIAFTLLQAQSKDDDAKNEEGNKDDEDKKDDEAENNKNNNKKK